MSARLRPNNNEEARRADTEDGILRGTVAINCMSALGTQPERECTQLSKEWGSDGDVALGV